MPKSITSSADSLIVVNTPFVSRKPSIPPKLLAKYPTIWPESLMPVATVVPGSAPGALIVVKTPRNASAWMICQDPNNPRPSSFSAVVVRHLASSLSQACGPHDATDETIIFPESLRVVARVRGEPTKHRNRTQSTEFGCPGDAGLPRSIPRPTHARLLASLIEFSAARPLGCSRSARKRNESAHQFRAARHEALRNGDRSRRSRSSVAERDASHLNRSVFWVEFYPLSRFTPDLLLRPLRLP